MPQGAVASQGSSGEGITHVGAVRIRVVGNGVLKTRLASLQDVRTQALANTTMQSPTDRMPVRLANFISQRTSLELWTEEIDEYFRVNRIVIFTKPIWTGYPQL